MLRFLVACAALLCATSATPALSQSAAASQDYEPFVRIDAAVLGPGDIALLRQLEQRQASETIEQRAALLERLAREPQRTPLQKIIIRSYQASLAFARNDPNGAVEVARDTVALFPNEHAAHASLADIAFHAKRFDVAAQALIGAIERDPGLVNRISAYDQTFLFDRLKEMRREDLSLTLARRLFDAGWTSGSLGLRSAQAGELVDDLLQKGDLAGAQRYAREIRSPQQIADILSAHHFRPLHQSIEEWAGARLEKQWTSYLNEAHARFTTAATAMSAWEYAGALGLAEHNRAIVDQILPLARTSFASSKDETWLFPLSNSATALAKLGRWEEAVRLLEDASRIAPDESTFRINMTGNIARLKLMKGDFSAASTLFAGVIAEARTNEYVNRATMANLESYRVCADHHSGRSVMTLAERLSTEWSPTQPDAMARMWLCLGKPDQAKRSWLAAAGDEDRLHDLLRFLQPVPGASYPSKFARDLFEEAELLRRDPELRQIALRVGTIRSWHLAAAAPRD